MKLMIKGGKGVIKLIWIRWIWKIVRCKLGGEEKWGKGGEGREGNVRIVERKKNGILVGYENDGWL